MMNESRKDIAWSMAWLAFVVGVLVILNGIHSSGEAIERLTLRISSYVFFFTGIGIVLTAIAVIVLLVKSDQKKK
jgi:hypothetical protein